MGGSGARLRRYRSSVLFRSHLFQQVDLLIQGMIEGEAAFIVINVSSGEASIDAFVYPEQSGEDLTEIGEPDYDPGGGALR